MKCPMQTVTSQGVGRDLEIDFFRCVQQECAWWDEQKVCCLLRTLTKQVERMAGKKEVRL